MELHGLKPNETFRYEFFVSDRGYIEVLIEFKYASGVAFANLSVDGIQKSMAYINYETMKLKARVDDVYRNWSLMIDVLDATTNAKIKISYPTDETEPEVVDYEPKGTKVPVDSEIVVVFSEEIDRRIEFSIHLEVDGKIDLEGKILRFEPESLEYGTTYTVQIYAEDLASNPVELEFHD